MEQVFAGTALNGGVHFWDVHGDIFYVDFFLTLVLKNVPKPILVTLAPFAGYYWTNICIALMSGAPFPRLMSRTPFPEQP